MVNRLDCLRHDSVVSCDDNDRDIRHFRSTCTHRREGRVTRSIQERDMLTILQLHVVCTDMLGDTSCLTGDHVGVTDVVQKRCLTVIDVTHDGDDRATRLHIFVMHHFIRINLFYHMRRHILGRETELLGH